MASQQAFAPDWGRFHAAIVSGTMQGEILVACERAWAWLELPAEDCARRIADTIRNEEAARWQLQALPFIRLRLLREAGMAPDDSAVPVARFDAVATGQASAAELALSHRLGALLAIGQLVGERFPDAALPPAPLDVQPEELLARTPALTEAMHACDVARATPQGLARLQAAIAVFDAAGSQAQGDIAREQAWWLGLAWWAAGRAALELGQQDEGRHAYERAVAHYTQAADAQAANDCRERLRDLAERRSADFDTAAGRELSTLLTSRDPLGRARALIRLARETGNAGDRYEAARLAEQAAQVLARAGYPDPEDDFDSAAQHWVDCACDSCTSSALIARLCEVAQYWAAILGARSSQRMQDDPAAAEHAELVLRRISPWAGELLNQAGQAEHAVAQRVALWCPPQIQALPERRRADPLPQGMVTLDMLDDSLAELRSACNERADPAQVDEARALRASAQQAGARIHVVRAWLEEAYVLLALQRPAEAAEASQQALDCLLAGAKPALSAFATGFERELYLTAISYQARALMATQDSAAIIALCEPVIRDLEGERLRVSSPYQQSAFLATRTELYEAVAAAAYNAGQLDLLLETTELLKARSALRNRLAPDMPLDATDVDAELRRVHAALEAAAPGSQEEHSLRERRHWLFSTRSIQRARSGNAMPQVSVASLQSHLGADEAAISWFWIGTAALIVLGVSSDRTIHTVIKLNGEQQARLADYIDCMHALAEPQPRYAVLIPKLDALIGELGPLLLPQVLHPVIAGKARLVLCPHRTLHLFAFHAVALNGNHLGVTHAIRYTPSLSHLLVPWHGNTQGGVLAVGVARFDDPVLPDLPHAEDEAITIAALHGPQGHALTTASRARFLSAPLESLRCLHLATHGSSVLAGAAVDDPLACGMHLRDGMLSGWDLLDLRLPAEVVVLATCHSAQRAIAGRGLQQLPGDDLFGLPAMLCQAGVHHLLGALWRVDDGAASAIVRDFHRAYASGATPDAALREAIRSYLADTTQRHEAFFWAPFTLTTFGR